MNFNNSAPLPPTLQNYGVNLGSFQRPSAPKPIQLKAPMIDRVHKAKPGCSACGKKIA